MSELTYEATSLDTLLARIILMRYTFADNGFEVDYQIFIGENNKFSATFVFK